MCIKIDYFYIITVDTTDYGLIPNNDLHGMSNSQRGGPGVQEGSSNTGMYVGIAVSLVMALGVALALVFFRT